MKNTKVSRRSIPKETVASKLNNKVQGKQKQKSKYKMDMIKRDNFDTMHTKENITQIKELTIKYVLYCIEGIYKNRFLYITTHKEGEIFGSGNPKEHGLTLQIEGAGLSSKHSMFRFDGFKSFDVLDFNSSNGTWLNIPKEGVQIRNGEEFSIGSSVVRFQLAGDIHQIEEICSLYHIDYLADILQHNGIHKLSQLYAAQYINFQGYPFTQKDITKLQRICSDTKKWYQQDRRYRKVNVHFMNEPLKDLSIEVGWQPFQFGKEPDSMFGPTKAVAYLDREWIVPQKQVFSKIQTAKLFPLGLHNQVKIGNLMFELNRFNVGKGTDVGFRPLMEDMALVEEDVGGSQWKLISLFAVFDGHGGPECATFFKDRLLGKIQGWTNFLDSAGDLNEMVKLLMSKTFYELDYEFYQEFPDLAETCGATALVTLIIESKVYAFSVGDCRGYLLRGQTLYQLNLEHLPSRGDERGRIEGAGGFIQYDRLMGKCTLSRCFGQFEYKNPEDYEREMKGKLRSYLSCIPDVVSFDLQPSSDEFLLLSTDGVFQVMDIAQIVQIFLCQTDLILDKFQRLELEESPNRIVSSIMENCKLISSECENMALLLIVIKKGRIGAKKSW